MFRYLKILKKIAALSPLLLCASISSQDENSRYLGLFGGFDALFIDPAGHTTEVPLPDGIYQSVAINRSGTAIAGGISGGSSPTPPAVSFISPSLEVTPISLPVANGRVFSVAINNSGDAIVGGLNNTTNDPIAFLISSSGTITPITPLPATNPIASVGLNDSSLGIIGGPTPPQSASLVSSGGTATPVTLPFITLINSVSINSFGTSIIGGVTNVSASAYMVNESGVATPLPIASSSGAINSVSINDNTTGIIGGGSPSITPLLYLVSSSGDVSQVTIPGGNTGSVTRVAINNNNNSIIAGSATTGPFVYLVSSSGGLTPVSLPGGHQITAISGVAINDAGIGAIVGQGLSGIPITFLVLPDGSLMGLSAPNLGYQAVALVLSGKAQIPIDGNGSSGSSLSGNNRIFATYINKNASQVAYYFIPSILAGTLPQALESAAPTRNAFALFTADNNLFFLNSSLSRHSMNARQFWNYSNHETSSSLAANPSWKNEHHLLADNDETAVPRSRALIQDNDRPYELWGDLFGAFAKQKAQHQTPAFEPTTGGLIVAFDGKALSGRVGVGAAYSYTHIHEKDGMGHGHINQEYLFLYGLWQPSKFYVDAALWAGYMQIENVRNIVITGFSTESKSHPKAWQLAPHLEFGYDYNCCNRVFMLEPYLMFDWISNWQKHYKETGTGPFNAKQKDHYSSFLRSELGLRFYEVIGFERWRLVLQEKAGYVNKKPFQVGRVTAALVGFPGSFTVETLTSPQNLGIAEMQFIFEPKNPRYPYGSIDYQGEFCPAYQSHQISLNITWNF